MRVFGLAVLLLAVAAPTAAAQQPNVFSKSAIDRVVARTISTTPASIAAVKAAPVPRSGKNFFKTPWPYLIAGGVIAGVIIAVNSGSNNGTGGY